MRIFSFVSILSCLLLLFLPLTSTPHPYFIGVSELQLYTAENRIELNVRLFTDDVELALRKTYGNSSDLLKGVKDKTVNGRLSAYLLKRLSVKLENELLTLEYVGYEIEADAIWCYFEGKYKGNPTTLQFQNRTLFEVLPEQQHIVHLKSGDKRKSARLNLDKDEMSWTW